MRRRGRLSRGLAVLGALALGLLWVESCGRRAGPAGPGQTVYAGSARTGAEALEGGRAVRVREEPQEVVLFDQDATPSDYRSPYRALRRHQYLKVVRPYDRAAFPRNIAPPTFRWEDEQDNLWLVRFTVPGWREPLTVVTDRREWRPDAATWEAIKASAEGRSVGVLVRGCRAAEGRRLGETVYEDVLSFRVSRYPTDPLIVYRSVTPLFHGSKTPDILCRDVSNFETRLFLPGEGTYCTNCHAFPVNPALPPEDVKLGIAVRDQTNPYRRKMILGIYDFASRQAKTLNINSYFMSWNADGKKLIVTAGNEVIVRPLVTLETQQFYVQVSDLLVVDTETLEVRPLPGASTREYMETLPAWSPDGKTILFSRAEELPSRTGFEERRFDLYAVAYNDGRGAVPVPVPGASANGMSNYNARYSPDGRWIVFNKAAYSSLVSPTAKLWIVANQEGATPRELDCNDAYAMNSHHSWSSNSRWLLFATKRDDGVFARLYLTEIDETGHAAPPVELPTDRDTMTCYNVPEFLRIRPDIDASDILSKTSTLRSVGASK